jgi:hypothetical protein
MNRALYLGAQMPVSKKPYLAEPSRAQLSRAEPSRAETDPELSYLSYSSFFLSPVSILICV